MVSIVLSPQALRDFEDLPTPIVARMRRLVDRLQLWPNVSGVKYLKGDLVGSCRLRTGDYRIQFRVEQFRRVELVTKAARGKQVTEEHEVLDYQLTIEKVGHRDGFYNE